MFTMQRGTLMSFTLRPMLVALAVTAVAASRCSAECSSSTADEPIVIVAPVAHQVVQRQLDSSKVAGADQADQRGFANVRVQLKVSSEQDPAVLECRVLTLPVASESNKKTTWQPLKFEASKDPNASPNEGMISLVRIPAGGWYRLEVRSKKSPDKVAAVEPFGVGEVFLVAGQSYATNTNDERLLVTDPMKRVAAKKIGENIWQVANDPQPAPDGSDGGSIWPALGDRLVTELNLPVGFVNVAVGGTSSTQWLPEGTLYPRLEAAGKSLGSFRAVLWQQGESDVIEKTSTERYMANIERIRRTAVDAWGFEPIWLCALSTHHPTVYNDPEGEGRIRTALQQLWTRPGFGPGPDTDELKGENRGDPKSRRHFSAIGQRRAADMWFDVLRTRINAP